MSEALLTAELCSPDSFHLDQGQASNDILAAAIRLFIELHNAPVTELTRTSWGGQSPEPTLLVVRDSSLSSPAGKVQDRIQAGGTVKGASSIISFLNSWYRRTNKSPGRRALATSLAAPPTYYLAGSANPAVVCCLYLVNN